MKKIFILSGVLTFIFFGFAFYKYTHHPDPRRNLCGCNFNYPEKDLEYLDFFANNYLGKSMVIDDNRNIKNLEEIKKGQILCFLRVLVSTIPFIFWVFTCCLMTLTPLGWKLDFWKKKFDSSVWGNIILPLVIIIPPIILIGFIIFLFKLLTNNY